MNISGTIQDHSIDLPITAPHVIVAPVHITTTETLHTADLLLTAITPETTADLDITPNTANTNQPKDHQQQHKHHLRNMKTRNKNIKQVIIDDPPSEYYSSDESESDSEDDLN